MPATFSFLNQLYTYNPISSPTWVISYSDDYTNGGFNYIYNLYSYNMTNNASYSFIGQYKIPPRPDGKGIFDLHKILKSEVNNDSSPTTDQIFATQSNVTPLIGGAMKFRYKYGFETDTDTTFSYAGSGTTSIPISGDSSNFIGFLTFSSISTLQTNTDVKVGDIINLTMSPDSLNPSLNGLNLVTGITFSLVNILGITTSNVTITLAGTGSTYEISDNYQGLGSITHYIRFTGTSSYLYGLNGVRQYYSSLNNIDNQAGLQDIYTDLDLIYGVPTYSKPLTSYGIENDNNIKTIFDDNYECTSFIASTLSPYSVSVQTFDINGNSLTSSTILTGGSSSSDYVVYTVPTGPSNLDQISSGILNGASSYNVIVNNGSKYMTVKRKIIDNCSPFKNYRLMFLNRLGGWDFYNFNYDSKLSMSVERKEFNKVLDWDYNVGDRGISVLTIDASEQVILTTDWISEYDYTYLKELITSPSVYLIDEDNKLKIPIVVTDTNWEQKTQLRDKVFFLTLTFKYSFNVNTQTY